MSFTWLSHDHHVHFVHKHYIGIAWKSWAFYMHTMRTPLILWYAAHGHHVKFLCLSQLSWKQSRRWQYYFCRKHLEDLAQAYHMGSHEHLIDITWTSHGYHMNTSWISHEHHMGTRYKNLVLTLAILEAKERAIVLVIEGTWKPHTSTPHEYHVNITLVSHEHVHHTGDVRI